MNIKSAYIHLLGDMFTSFGVLIAGLVMKFYGFYWIDPVLSIVIALYLIYVSWDIFRSSLDIIMESAPAGIDLQTIAREIAALEGVKNIHHVHIWQINEHDIMLEGHIEMEKDIALSEFEKILKQIYQLLHRYNIHHITLQPEFTSGCNDKIIKDC